MRPNALLLLLLSLPMLAGTYDHSVVGVGATQQIRYVEAGLLSDGGEFLRSLRLQLTGALAERRESTADHSRHLGRVHLEVGVVESNSSGPFLLFGPLVSADKGLGIGFRAMGGYKSGPVWTGLSAETATGLKPALGLRIAIQF